MEDYEVEFITRGRSGPFTGSAAGSSALVQLDRATKEWIGIAYRLMGETTAVSGAVMSGGINPCAVALAPSVRSRDAPCLIAREQPGRQWAAMFTIAIMWTELH